MTSRSRTLLVVILGVVALAGLGPGWPQSTGRTAVPAGPSEAWATATDEPRAPLRAVLRAVLEAYLTNRRMPEHISAVSLRVTFPGRRPIDVAVGSIRFDGGPHIVTSSFWQIGSHTKAFTSVVLLQLAAEGALSIDDTLARWLPQYPEWGHIAIRELLNMTSGIPDYTGVPAFLTAYAAAPDTVFAAPKLVSYAVGRSPLPGWNYSNTNYILAQMIIERATVDTLARQLRTRIIRPLALRHTFYCPEGCPPGVVQRLPSSYLFLSVPELAPLYGEDQRRRNLSYGQGAGAIISSLSDLTTWLRALYGGRLLPPTQQRDLESLVAPDSGRPLAAPSPANPVGFGLGVSQLWTELGRLWFYQAETYGCRTVHIFDPASGIAIAIGANSSMDHDELFQLARKVYETLRN
jgi:D-alanyl-D-alanine carboxypeptidase